MSHLLALITLHRFSNFGISFVKAIFSLSSPTFLVHFHMSCFGLITFNIILLLLIVGQQHRSDNIYFVCIFSHESVITK